LQVAPERIAGPFKRWVIGHMTPEQWFGVFSDYDSKHNGHLSTFEAKKLLQDYEIQVAESEMDSYKSGKKFDFQEFCKLWVAHGCAHQSIISSAANPPVAPAKPKGVLTRQGSGGPVGLKRQGSGGIAHKSPGSPTMSSAPRKGSASSPSSTSIKHSTSPGSPIKHGISSGSPPPPPQRHVAASPVKHATTSPATHPVKSSSPIQTTRPASHKISSPVHKHIVAVKAPSSPDRKPRSNEHSDHKPVSDSHASEHKLVTKSGTPTTHSRALPPATAHPAPTHATPTHAVPTHQVLATHTRAVPPAKALHPIVSMPSLAPDQPPVIASATEAI
jgi:hypothetical protein